MSGPVPQREDALARPRKRKGGDQTPVTKGELRPVKIPRADSTWHPIAKMLWKALADSGQSDFYQQSDWAFAFSLCEDLSYYKTESTAYNAKTDREYTKPRSGQMLQSIYSAMERLLVTEGDRRRVRIELHEPEEQGDGAAVLAIADYQKDLGLAD